MDKTWWKEAVVYQVYWRSFYDSNGDGIGDLQGLLEKLDHIQNLGVDVIWLNPCYESPDVDNGYDIADYYGVMRKAGDMATFERLLHAVHQRGMKLIMDLVVNHTSNQHPWFIESSKSKDNPYRDYYIWRDMPNNWRSYFEPSAWSFDSQTEQYYFHSFAVEQPDLNWESTALRTEIYKMMRFWLDKGIDGFRLDAIALLAKQDGFPDADNVEDISYLTNNPKLHEYIQEMNQQVFSHYDIFTVGETGFTTPEMGLLYVDESRHELNTLFHFQVLDEMPTWNLQQFKQIQKTWYDALWGKGWNSQFINNHDHARVVSRYGNDLEYRVESAKLFATLVHTLPGTAYVYQGEEIGMTGVRFASIDDYNDVAMKNKYHEEIAKGRDQSEVFESLLPLSRDNSRTPMQWDDTRNAGFTVGTPWIQVNPNYTSINVRNDLDSDASVYRFYQKLIALRKQSEALVYGSFQPVMDNEQDIYAYKREWSGEQLFVILNFASSDKKLRLDGIINLSAAELVIGNYDNDESETEMDANQLLLRPYEARVYRLLNG